MEKFLDFTQMAHLLVGFDFSEKFKDSLRIQKVLIVVKYSNLFVLIFGFLQMLLYLIIEGFAGQMFIDTIYLIILNIHGIFKVFMELKYAKKIKDFINRIDDVYKQDLGGHSTEHGLKFAEFSTKVWWILYIIASLMPVMQIVIKFIKYFITPAEYLRSSEIFLFGCYFPFDSYNYLPWTFIYTCVIHLRTINTCVVLDHVAIFKTILLTNCFEKLGEDVKEAINGSESRGFLETKKIMANTIDVHNKLLEFCAELNDFYKHIFSLSAMTDTFILATVGYMSAVSFN